MSTTDTIKNRGFLSAEIEQYRKNYRKAYSQAFAACEEKSDAITQRLFSADMSMFNTIEHLHVILSVALWMRCTSTCQGALLMLEKGMVPEAQILIRTAFEYLFYAVAGLKDPEILQSMIAGDSHARKKQAGCMKMEGKQELTQEQIEMLAKVIMEHSEGKEQINVFNAARKAGMAYLYSTVYRGMSFVAAHATLAATDSVFEEKDNGFDLTFGPSDKNLSFTLSLVHTCLANGAQHFDSILQPSS